MNTNTRHPLDLGELLQHQPQPWFMSSSPSSAAGVGRAARFLDGAPLPGPGEMMTMDMARPQWPERGEGSPTEPQGAACPCSCSGYAGVCVCQGETSNYFGEECADSGSVSSQSASYADGDCPVRTRPLNDGLLANYHAPIVQVISRNYFKSPICQIRAL